MNNFYRFLARSGILLVLVFLPACAAIPPASQSLPPDDSYAEIVPTPTAFQPQADAEQGSNASVYIPQVSAGDAAAKAAAGYPVAPTQAASQSPASQTAAGGLPPERWQEWPVIPAISENARAIYQAGIASGHDPRKFAKIGDCQNIHQYFLGIYDNPDVYVLGPYADLQTTIDYYAGNWLRDSAAVRTGYNVASVLSPINADPATCNSGETPLACEFRLQNPSFALISMETWTPDRPIELYEKYLREIVEYALARNVLPIVATKADNLEGNHAINLSIARVAYEYDIPLWNFWLEVQPLPDHGLMEDRFHLTNGPSHFDDPEAMNAAWLHRNLSALQVIDALRKAVAAQ